MRENNVIPFIYEDRPVRVILDDRNDPWWVAKDVCDILELTNPSKALQALDDDEKDSLNTLTNCYGIPSQRGNPNISIVNEPGLYTLIIRSTKPKARVFRRWITHEVLPSIRKTGTYAVSLPEKGKEGDDPAVVREIPGHVWNRIRSAGKGVRLSNRIKLLSLACQMNRLDQTFAPTRANVLLDYAELCSNICTAPELPADEQDDCIDAFIDACCFVEPGAKVQAADIYARFVAWYLENVGDAVPTGTSFGRRLSERYKKSKSQGVVMYHGIGLKEEEDGENLPA